MLDLKTIGQGATTKIYHDGNKAIKLYENALHNEAENEAKRQDFAYNSGLPVPVVYGVRRLDEKTVALDMEYINGQGLMHRGMDKDERNNATRTMVKLQREVHKIQALNQPKQIERIKWKIMNTRHLNDSLKAELLSLLACLDDGSDCLCHGDLHPLNILYDGNKHWIIDWVDAAAGNPLADACRTYLILKQYMSRSAGIYLKTFCNETNSKKDDILNWLPVIAAARLDENMDDESRNWLLEIVMSKTEEKIDIKKNTLLKSP